MEHTIKTGMFKCYLGCERIYDRNMATILNLKKWKLDFDENWYTLNIIPNEYNVDDEYEIEIDPECDKYPAIEELSRIINYLEKSKKYNSHIFEGFCVVHDFCTAAEKMITITYINLNNDKNINTFKDNIKFEILTTCYDRTYREYTTHKYVFENDKLTEIKEENINELKYKIKELENKILELELKPPTEGGELYNKAKKEFDTFKIEFNK